ncbi:HD domain-containing phosphohydrolase [Neptuniibacter sp. CAU 1671]|uniref:HD domain-containing phosphohydrolase n=1 Tax=Neptuniibacter sp. CAU 1671 TaxID=3032593 RepID=UPI0023DB4896|nr:HD domain-containing phosphohydrolase [Neptuniibacter sp. CAU 1671]MDF2181724.1 cache domain-containing protein [Neptuniibacter sp. CAU 1671]
MTTDKPFQMSLQTVLSGVLVISTLLVSLMLVGKSYYSSRALLIEASSVSAQHLGENIDTQMLRLISPLDSTLRLLTHDPLVVADTLLQRGHSLPMLAEALKANPIVSSVYAGYPDGSFFLVRALKSAQIAESLAAPDRAAYMVQSVERSQGARVHGEWRFYDQQLQLIKSVPQPDYQFDPRSRPWFKEAAQDETAQTILTQPYVFFTSGEIGITLARKDAASGTVIGLDASVQDLSVFLRRLRLTEGTELAVINSQGRIIAYPDLAQLVHSSMEGALRLAHTGDLTVPVLHALSLSELQPEEVRHIKLDGQEWYGLWVPLATLAGSELKLMIALPADELLADAKSGAWLQLLWTGVIILLLLLLALLLGRRIFRPFGRLSHEIENFAAFDFSQPVHANSRIAEVNELSRVLSHMSGTIVHFQKISRTLAREKDLDRMLEEVTYHLKESTAALGGVIYLYDEDSQKLSLASQSDLADAEVQLSCDDCSTEGLRSCVRDMFGADKNNVLTTALLDRQGQPVGVLGLKMPDLAAGYERSHRRFITEMSGSAATAIETRRQVEVQRNLIDAIIQLLADAIDAKSPYTGGHCERVPELAGLLLDAAEASQEGPFAEFSMDETARYEFQIAAWLHDCGKIISPEYVVDKATKLETIYNRIHEIRTRFEVLWRDAEIAYLKHLQQGGEADKLAAERDKLQQQLQQEFAFVAEANLGGEFMKPEDIERLQQIGQRTWLRYFDNRLGLSRDESSRLVPCEAPAMPVEERLLADRPEHLVPWSGKRPPVERDNPDNIWGFDMVLPEHAFNLGELHNLSIQRGTLTAEERFKINDHIVQTICMLSSLPLPSYLKKVPDIAGNHHEKMDGTGYPRRLEAASLSLPERIMAVADIFEALTAADRPYKESKTLAESLKIMAFMARDKHIDAELFRLFVTQEVYQKYAEGFMQPHQITPVDKEQLLSIAEGS